MTWVPLARETNATFVEFLLTRRGIESLQMNNFQPTMDRPIAHWYLTTGENFLVVSRAGHLDDERLVGTAATATSIRPPDGTIPTDAV